MGDLPYGDSASEKRVKRGSRTSEPRSIDPDVAAIVDSVGRDPEDLVEVLRQLKAQRGDLTSDAMAEVSRALRIPPSRVHGVATFYSLLASDGSPAETIQVCDGPCCSRHGAGSLLAEVHELLGPDWTVTRTSCLGLCDRAPAALVGDQQVGPVALHQVPELGRGWSGAPADYRQPRRGETRVLLPNPRSESDGEHATGRDDFPALRKALSGSPDEVLDVLEASGLRGRGGAGFPSGRKWRMVAREPRQPKYVVCNADESEPLSFKDRVLLELQPARILEAMAIVAYAIGATDGYVYVRGEYGAQTNELAAALDQARREGWLGSNIAGTGFHFDVHIHRGAGAYICGEETALLESLEGKRGEPRTRPPFPTTSGFRGAPTSINNVETLAAVPSIMTNGAAWHRGLGDPRTPGTKLYTLLGAINRPGLFEAPYGLTLRQMIEQFGEGMCAGSTFNFAVTGGAAGTLAPPDLLDVPIDYESSAQGVTLGSGGFLICDQTVSAAVMLRELLAFFEHESCGKCTPCRIGVHEARQLVDRIVAGNATASMVERLSQLARILRTASQCGLGSSVARPIQSALQYFPECFAMPARE